jgi:hypothetical protein
LGLVKRFADFHLTLIDCRTFFAFAQQEFVTTNENNNKQITVSLRVLDLLNLFPHIFVQVVYFFVI